jgi:hypothetical protein
MIARAATIVRSMMRDALELRAVAGLAIVTCLIGTLALPARTAGYAVVEIGYGRPPYDPAFVALVLAITGYVTLTPALFAYLRVVSPLSRQPLALVFAAPITRLHYWMARWLADCAVLCVPLATLAVSGAILTVQRGEAGSGQSLWSLPLVLAGVGVPVISLLAGFRALAEAHPVTRGRAADVAMLAAWIAAISFCGIAAAGSGATFADPFGISAPLRAIAGPHRAIAFGFQNALGYPLATLAAAQGALPADYGASRVAWFCAGAAMAALSSFWLVPAAGSRAANTPAAGTEGRTLPRAAPRRPSILRLIGTEIAQTCAGGMWKVLLAGIVVVGAICPLRLASAVAIPCAWAFLSFRLGDLGLRTTGGTFQPVMAALPLRSGTHAVVGLAAGTAVGWIALAAVLLRAVVAPDVALALGVAGSAAMAAMAIGLGRVARSPVPFTIVSLLICYALATRGGL